MASQPTTGGYGCVDLSSLFSWAIRQFTHSEFSHAFVVLNAATGLILEAQPSGSKLSNISKYKGLEMVFSEDSASADPNELAYWAARFVGIPYGFLDIVYLGLELGPIPLRPAWLLDAVLDEHNMICSQLVAAFGESLHRNWRCGQEHAQLVTPGALATRAA